MRIPEFPSKTFVVHAMAAYFADAGFESESTAIADLQAVASEGGVRWIVEAIGGSEPDEELFHLCLGKLLTSMNSDAKSNYVLAMPARADFEKQCARIAPSIQQMLNLWWGLVADDGSVVAVKPEQCRQVSGVRHHEKS